MATSIAAQLQKIRAITHTEPESTKRPFTRPSILFDPKQAADIDLDALLSLALSGLEALEQIDNRFGSYKNSLFSPNSRDLDRELKGIDENKKIDESIASYLRLVSGYLQLHSALKTLEYLIRRYKIYHYNMDELILCSLPYHDTHVFVGIVQILNLGNSRWKFLEGVKVSGAPPPRSVIVQQCIRDKGVLETLCNYALPTKKYKPSVPVLNFFTAVAVEFLGTLPVIDSDTVRRLLPFVFSGLETNSKAGRDHKASALMMVSLLSNKVALNHKSVKVLIESIARVARQDASESADLPWLRMLLMAMISLVQSQSVEILSKKALELLQETRDFTGVLLGLSKEFNIKRFLYTYLESLATYSSSEHYYHLALASAIEALPVKEFIDNIVAKVLTSCLMLSKSEDSSKLCESGCQTKELLDIMGKKYPSELQRAVHRFLEDPKVKSFKENSVIEKLGAILGGKSNVTPDISDSMILLSLEHPKAEIRRTTLSSLVASGGFKPKTYNSQTLVNIRDAVLRRLHDEDLSVIKTALSLKDLSDIVDSSYLIGALKDVLFRCIDTIMTSELIVTPLACEVAISCLNCVISNFQSQLDFSKGVATMIFPLLLAFAKTWRLNVKALELAKGIKWSLYRYICGPYELISAIDEKKLESSMSTSVNMKIIQALAEAFSANPEEYMTWFDECAKSFALSKTIILLVLLQSFVIRKEEPEHILRLFNTCFHTLKLEWVDIELLEDVPKEEVNSTKLDEDCSRFLEQLQNRNCKALHLDLLICIFWKLLKAFIPSASPNSLADNVDWLGALDSLFTFFVESRSKNLFKEHIKLLVLKCHSSPVLFLTKFHMMEGYSVLVQVESLLSFASICSQTSSSEKCTSDRNLQLLLGFPSVLVPFSSDNQDVRFAAMKCIEALYSLWHNINSSAGKNGNDSLLQQSMWSPFLGELLELLIEQKRLILSDRNFFPAYLTAILSSYTDNILVPLNIDQRFDKRTKEAIFLFILSSALKLSPFGKLKVLLLFKGMSNAVVRVEGVKSLLSELLERRNKCHLGVDKYGQPLSKIEIETLCFLLESCATPSASQSENTPSDQVVEALQLNSFSSEDPAVIQPCVAVLQLLNPVFQCRLKTETQEKVFEELVFLFRNDTASIQNAAKEAILRVKLPISTIVRFLDLFTAQGLGSSGLSNGKKKKKLQKEQGGIPHNSLFFKWENRISFLGSLLDILLLKKDIENRCALTAPLFKLLSKLFADEWLLELVEKDAKLSEASSWASTICYIQQTVLTILEEISVSLSCDTPQKDNTLQEYDVKLLLECARSATDPTTRNHVLSLVSSIAKNMPEKVFEHIIGIFTVIGESAAKQSDSHSQRVFEDLISTIVPCWLSKASNADSLLQIFVDVLPEIAEHRRLTIMVFFLRTLGERNSLASLLILLIRSAVKRKNKSGSDEILYASVSSTSVVHSAWEFRFALQVCAQYSCMIWLPSLVRLLKQAQNSDHLQEQVDVLSLVVQFVLQKLQDTELGFKLESGEDSDDIQRTLGALLEQVVLLLQIVNSRGNLQTVPIDVKKELKDSMHSVLKAIIKKMLPSAFFDGINLLLGRENGFMRKKALKLLCEAVNDRDMLRPKHKEKRNPSQNSSYSLLHLDGNSTQSFVKMCSNIVQLIDASDEGPDTLLKVAAISTLENLANSFSANTSVFTSCLTSVSKQICSQNLSISCNCLRASGALIKVLDTKEILPELPKIMGTILSKVRNDLCLLKKSKHSSQGTITGVSGLKESLPFSILVTLEAVIEKLGRFLSPYLGDIIELMVLSPELFSESDLKIKVKADAVRKLITEKIDVRYILTPLLEIYHKAVELSESSVLLVLEMLSCLIGKMDRVSISSYHGKIFEKCLLALDLRRAHPESIKNVHLVEKGVIHAMLGLTMKVTETMFRPLFRRSRMWSETLADGHGSTESTSLDRVISFYSFVNELVEHQRSLFVPYFKDLIDGCTRNLMEGQVTQSTGVPHKRKKSKLEKEGENALSLRQWHLRALILSSLQKCFLYDTGSNKFLNSSNFQVLLKPIVSQLIAEPPNSLEEFPDVPSVNEVNDILVSCLGQMAVTAGSDLLWKPLNHEVLMQTRSENVRARILGLRVVKYFVEHLKEEYLVFLPETIPFLGELLEDIELPVKSLAQEILKEMETLSGESLRQYL